jgi:hypothetical protein
VQEPAPKTEPSDVETDERFPSGEWLGFYLQPSVSKTKTSMRLQLSFRRGLLSGEGDDPVGRFTMRGRYDTQTDRVSIHKQYAGRGEVEYRGYAESGKGIWGVWAILKDRGGFHLWPKGMPNPTGASLHEEAQAPASTEPATAGVGGKVEGRKAKGR